MVTNREFEGTFGLNKSSTILNADFAVVKEAFLRA